jgi:MyTH4 domain
MTSFFLDNDAWYTSLFLNTVAIGQNQQWAESRKCQLIIVCDFSALSDRTRTFLLFQDAIQKPMIRTENKLVKKEALEVFKLIQMYMGDRKLTTKDVPMSSVAFDIISRGSVIDELRDEIFIQICRQTMRNPRE